MARGEVGKARAPAGCLLLLSRLRPALAPRTCCDKREGFRSEKLLSLVICICMTVKTKVGSFLFLLVTQSVSSLKHFATI